MADNRHAEINLVDLERGTAMSVLCEFDLSPRQAGTYRIVKVELAYDDAVTGRNEILTSDVEMEFTSDKGLVASGVNPIVRQEFEIAQASKNLEKTVMGMKTQQISAMGATMELQRTMTLLASQGRMDEATQVRSAIDSIQHGGQDAQKTLIGVQLTLEQGKKK
jgi:Ca-activated chloride channel family protein